jgi:hypothetical protein
MGTAVPSHSRQAYALVLPDNAYQLMELSCPARVVYMRLTSLNQPWNQQ